MSVYKPFHRITQLLTLYMQKRWEQDDWGGFSDPTIRGINNWDGMCLLPILLPVDEASRLTTHTYFGWTFTHGEDYDQVLAAPTGGGLLISSFLAPRFLSDRLTVKGTGYLCWRLSAWVAAGGTLTFREIYAEIEKYSESDRTAQITPHPNARWNIGWVATNTAEEKRSYFFELPNLDFTLDPSERLAIRLISIINAQGANCYARNLFKRGEAESYLMLPVKEG